MNKNPGRASNEMKPLNFPPPCPVLPAHPHPRGAGAGITGSPIPGEGGSSTPLWLHRELCWGLEGTNPEIGPVIPAGIRVVTN